MQTSKVYTLSLHDALPICNGREREGKRRRRAKASGHTSCYPVEGCVGFTATGTVFRRSEEHTSELQSRFDVVCRLLLEKKKSDHINGLSEQRSSVVQR